VDELDIDAGLALAEELSQPRLCGTLGEKRASDLLQERFGMAGWHSVEQSVVITNAVEINLKLLLLLAATVCVAGWFSSEIFLFFVSLFVIIILKAGKIVWSSSAEGKTLWVRRRRISEAANLIFLSAPEARPDIWLCAHYDSKGQTQSLLIRLLLITGSSAALAISCFAALGYLFVAEEQLALLQKIFTSVALVCLLPLLFIRTTNASPGALDNAGSVAAIYTLFNAVQRRAFSGRVGIVLTTGEEWGLVGGFAAAKWLAERYSGRPMPLVINLEGIGGSTNLRWRLPPSKLQKGRRDELTILRSEPGIKLLRLLPGAAADHLAFWHHEIPAVTLFAFGNKIRHIHRPADSFEKIDVKAFTFATGKILNILKNLSQPSMITS